MLQAGAAFSIMSPFKSSLPQEFKYLQEKYVGGLVVGWLHQILQINVVFPEKASGQIQVSGASEK